MKTRIICRIFCAFLVLLSASAAAQADYLGSWAINDYLVIKANTHRLSSGAAYSASSITYRIYEDDTSTEIVSDTAMTEFDSETGFYLNKVQLLAATGFEAGKCYTVLVKATVDGVSGTKSDTFQIGLNTGKLAGNALPTASSDVFDDLVTASGEGSTIALNASGQVTVGTNNDKTDYKLASDGLDSVSTAAPSGVPTDFREMMVMVYRRFFKKVTMTSTVLSTYADDGSTVLTEQDLSDPGSLRTTGAAQAP
jgi:hypothetical protein